jgi:hypothetical protein
MESLAVFIYGSSHLMAEINRLEAHYISHTLLSPVSCYMPMSTSDPRITNVNAVPRVLVVSNKLNRRRNATTQVTAFAVAVGTREQTPPPTDRAHSLSYEEQRRKVCYISILRKGNKRDILRSRYRVYPLRSRNARGH